MGFRIVFRMIPAVQVTSSRSTVALGELDVVRAEDVLREAGIEPIAQDFGNSQVLFRFDSVETQIKAKSLIQSTLGSDFITALNLAPTTPDWLQSIGANPMKLGLDLRGRGSFFDGSGSQGSGFAAVGVLRVRN